VIAETKLRDQAFLHGIRTPTKRTLDKFGLTEVEWLRLLHAQGWRCAICALPKKTWNTDHEHVIGWAKFPPEKRKLFVRGVICWHCNKFNAPSNMDAAMADRLAIYLRTYEVRRDIELRKEGK
jgi:hypothetical protein